MAIRTIACGTVHSWQWVRLSHLQSSTLQRPIVVVDSRKRPLISLMLYRPEYVLPCALALGEACKMRTSNPACLWVRLHGEHFRALLPRVIDIC